ncbi:T9SS type A sorting domain-containing protein [Owenweeksia hongkongensis]|uniref:T9SS type A sorting domain-containing protein n=1 Tax=Owenweeksia hongkongensis TaxID=253245 RepID=UPI003A8CE5DD
MKKLVLLLSLSLFASSTFASHLLGGEITWEKTANGQFVFELKLYKECGGFAAGLSSVQTIIGPNDTILVTQQSVVEISPVCLGNQVSCITSTSGQGAVEMFTYRNTTPVTLAGTPPAAGWDFYFTQCCLPGTVNTNGGNHHIVSTMYPGASSSSPYFAITPNQFLTKYNKTYAAGAKSVNPDDSLYHNLVFARTSVNQPIIYNAGYSSTSPFPSSTTNASNGAISIDGNTGLISYDIQVAPNGLYAFAVEVEQWRNGVLIARINRQFCAVYNGSVSPNNVPATYIDTTAYTSINQTSDYAYKADVTVGDTLEFTISSTDADINQSTFLPQQIAFHAFGSSLDTSFGPQGIPGGAKLHPVSPQVGYVKALNNNIKFSWVITNAHFNPSNNSHFFDFVMKDDHCPYPGVANFTLQVVVRKEVDISTDTVRICAGDSVRLDGYSKDGIYSWFPSVGLSDATVNNPMASPSASGYYYLTNGSNTVSDSVYVEVTTPAAFTLAQNGGLIELTDANPATSTMWYYNGIAFNYPHDTLPISGYGDYWVKGEIGACTLLSDTVTINTGSSFSVTDPSKSNNNGVNLPITGSHGITFTVSQSANLQSVSIPGVEDLFAKKSTGYDLNLKIYDANQMEVYTTDITIQRPMNGLINIPVNYSLSANTDYTLAISGDSAYTFSMLGIISLPITPFDNGITVKNSAEGDYGKFPALPTGYLIPFTLNTDVQVVSLYENEAPSFRIYPNPAANRFTIDGLDGDSEIQILDVNGKLVSEIRTVENSITVERGDLSAGIYFVKISNLKTTSIQKVMFD